MQPNYVNPRTQPRFSALLRYYGHGDFGRFCHAADLAYSLESTKDKYFSANLLLAAQIAGVCEVSTASGSTEWWVSHTGNICIDSRRRKEIGLTEEWFLSNENCVAPLIADANGSPLMLGKVRDASFPGSLFDRALGDILPAFKDIERQLCSSGSFSREAERNEVQVFRPATGRWDPTNASLISGPHLVRARDQYSGWSFFIQHAEVGLRVRITQPEWAFVIAYHLLPWKIEDLYRARAGNIEMYRSLRLPALIFRTLFAAASAVIIGPTVTFLDVQESCVMGLNSYFAQARA